MKIVILKEENLNTIKETGIYFQSANTNTIPERGYPIKQAGWLIVIHIDESWSLQIYYPYSSEKMFTRVYYILFSNPNDGWNNWVEFNGVYI